MGREQPRPMEPPQHRGTEDYQPLAGLASQVKEPRTASSPKHLQPDQTHPKPTVRNRDPSLPVRSRWQENPENEKVCTDRQYTSYTERTPDQWSYYTRRVCRFRFPPSSLGLT